MAHTAPQRPSWRKCLVSPQKQRYTCERAAVLASRRIEFASGKRLDAYFCQGCQGWHLTSRSVLVE